MEEFYQKQRTFEQQIFMFVNKERRKAGLIPLILDPALTKAARVKAEDMAVNNYFDHISPVLKSPLAMIKSFGVQFRVVGENIASGFPDPKMVFKEWMRSKGHRANILNPAFSHLGVGYYYSKNGNFQHYWVQEFVRK